MGPVELEPDRAPQVPQEGQYPFFAQHGMDLGLQPGPEPGQLVPVAHQLAQLPQRPGGDPRLRQRAETQQVGQHLGVGHLRSPKD